MAACNVQDVPSQPSVDSATPTITSSLTTIPPSVAPASATAIPTQKASALSATSTVTSTHTPLPLTCWNEGGRIEIQQFQTETIPSPLYFRIYLPLCYDVQTTREYPTLYLLHGQTFTDDQWDRLGVDETADQLIGTGELPPFIIVMPREEDMYTRPPENLYGETIVNELIPYIDQTFRTIDQRASRAIGGISRGGNWAVHLGLSQWDVFGAIGAHSTPTFATDGPQRIRDFLSAIPDDKMPRIYLDTGVDDGWNSYTFDLEALFTEQNIPHEWYLFQGTHDEEYWANHIEEYLRWYAHDW